MRMRSFLLGCVVTLLGPAGAGAQAIDLPRLVAQYRAGNAVQAIDGLQQLLRVATNNEQRALAEHHLGMALLRVRPADASVSLRRSIALDPDLQPDPAATPEERAAWSAARAELPVPSDVMVNPDAVILGARDSLGITVVVPRGSPRPPARVRLRVLRAGLRDTVTVWNGRSGVKSSWDGYVAGVPLASGQLTVVVEAEDDGSPYVVQWRRQLDVRVEPVRESLRLPERPAATNQVDTITMIDQEGKAKGVQRSLRWSVAGLAAAALSSALVPTAIDYSAAGSAPRIGVAAVYGLGLAATAGGIVWAGLRLSRTNTTSVIVPDEAAIRQYRAALGQWAADSARIDALNGRLGELTRLIVRVGGPQ